MPTINVNSFAGTDIDSFFEQPYARSKLITYVSTDKECTIRHYMTPGRLHGDPPSKVKLDDNFRATFAASPAFGFVWNIGGLELRQSATQDIRVWVQITYYVEFRDRVVQTAS